MQLLIQTKIIIRYTKTKKKTNYFENSAKTLQITKYVFKFHNIVQFGTLNDLITIICIRKEISCRYVQIYFIHYNY